MSGKTERAWLVELTGPYPLWWVGIGFSQEPNSALRFARRIDAERAIKMLVGREFAPKCIATEHQWEGR